MTFPVWGVIKKEVGRYLYQGEQKSSEYARHKGRPFEIIKPKIHELMTINWKTGALLGLIAVALVVIGLYQFGTKTSQAPVVQEPLQAPIAAPAQELPPAVAKPATGDVDDAVDAILAGVSDDEALFADAEKDAELITADSQALSDFGQSYNENEF